MGIIITKFLIVAAIAACGMYVCCVIYTETERELRDIMAIIDGQDAKEDSGQILTPTPLEFCVRETIRETPKEERRPAAGKTAAAEGRTDLDPKAWGRYYQLRRQMTNNYRKMHGMPMIRRLKRRRAKRT
jgi:hypothetical protein